jgi:hypothetical protein
LQGWSALEGASVSYGKAMSYLPVINLLKGYFEIQDQDDLRQIREKVTGKLLTLDESLSPSCRHCWPCSMCPSTTAHGRHSIRDSVDGARSTRSSICCCAKHVSSLFS